VVRFTPRPLYSEERAPGTPRIGKWVGPIAGLDTVVAKKKKAVPLPGTEPRSSISVSHYTEISRLLDPPRLIYLFIYIFKY